MTERQDSAHRYRFETSFKLGKDALREQPTPKGR